MHLPENFYKYPTWGTKRSHITFRTSVLSASRCYTSSTHIDYTLASLPLFAYISRLFCMENMSCYPSRDSFYPSIFNMTGIVCKHTVLIQWECKLAANWRCAHCAWSFTPQVAGGTNGPVHLSQFKHFGWQLGTDFWWPVWFTIVVNILWRFVWGLYMCNIVLYFMVMDARPVALFVLCHRYIP